MYEWMASATKQLPKGAFLLVNGNPMTIGWAQFGVIWGKLCCTIYVRKSRYTHDLLDTSDEFTISIPKYGEFAKELAVCGSKSGRDVNKMQLCGMSICPKCGGIVGCQTHLQCKILCSYDLDPSRIDPAVMDRYYKDLDMHTAYIAQIDNVEEV